MTKAFYKEKYPHLFEPFVVGKGDGQMVLKNRVLVGPMLTQSGTNTDGSLNDYGIEFYGKLARGGFASFAVPMEIPQNGGHARSVIIDNEETIPFQDVHRLQHVAHAYRAKSFCEIYHPGCCMSPGPGREDIIAAEDMVWNGHTVRGMNRDDMENIANLYAQSAFMAKRAGFDAIMLHYGHGWLMNNFLSPLSNHRTDEFGGSVENRCRFPIMVIKRIRERVGNMPIEVRMNGSDRMEGGITIEDAVEQAKLFEAAGVDMIHVSCGTRLDAHSRAKMHPTHFVPPGHNVGASEAMKKAGIKIPIGVIGAIHTPELAEEILATGKADYVLMARQANVDADWVNKVKAGCEEDIRPCIRCDYCFDVGRRGALSTGVTYDEKANYDLYCAVNPVYTHAMSKLNPRFIPWPTKKEQVAIIGGGIAGLQAALTAAERGHAVTLYEKKEKLGGQLNVFVDHMWFKDEIKRYLKYMIRQVEKAGVQIVLNCEVTRAFIEEKNPDVVIVAVGAEQIVPPIPGVDGPNVVMANDVFGHEDQLGKNVVVIGGGMVGCELAVNLHDKNFGTNITILEMGDYIAANSQLTQRMDIIDQMDARGIQYQCHSKCVAIDAQGVYVEQEQGNRLIPADNVIICVGNRPCEKVRDQFNDVAFEVIPVGDCLRAADISHATRTGYDAAITCSASGIPYSPARN